MKQRHVKLAGLGLLVLLLGASASAQTSLVADKAAVAQTNVVAEGSQKALSAEEFAVSDETSFKLAAGTSIQAGNTNSVNLSGAANLRLKRSLNQLTIDLAANWGMAALATTDASGQVQPTRWDQLEPNAENYQGRFRYDRFLSKRWAVFAMLQGRRDRFQAFDLRLNFDPGLSYYFIQKPEHKMRLEAGYDLQYDVRQSGAIAALNAGLSEGDPGYLYPEVVRHGMRADFAYEIALNKSVGFVTELEWLAPFEFDPVFPFRLNWTNGLSANISSRFALVTAFTVRYDNAPIGRQNTDILASLNLSYTLF